MGLRAGFRGCSAPETARLESDQGDSTGTAAGFAELMEGTFVLTGAEEERYDVSDDQFGFRTGGGCQGGADADLDQRRMTMKLLGTLSSSEGDVDLDATSRWVMGCP